MDGNAANRLGSWFRHVAPAMQDAVEFAKATTPRFADDFSPIAAGRFDIIL
jgi:hypothetical protein